MTTTIDADSAYTHLISNGNVSRSLNPEGRPVPKEGSPGRQVITFDNSLPMAPYLFLVCAGTWDTLSDTVTYPSGRTVRLEYLVPPGTVDEVRIPMEILKASVLWIKKTQDYEYTGDTYRTICMTKSNFGGMENTGNTTIVTDAALINEHTMDSGLLYAHAVIVHEFEHNQCGSETTMDTPFDVWLNEAYTVDVERQFMADTFEPSFIRLFQVDSIRNPLLGPLAIEDAGHAGRIVREGFNDPDELIDGVTYVKAAEVIRMLRLIIGPDNFRDGKKLYFSRYHNGNATTDQFFECFEEASGIPLEQFKKEWLYTVGYPGVIASTHYEGASGKYRIAFHQEVKPGQSPFHIPIVLALVDKNGHDIKETARVFQLREHDAELVFENITEAPAFASMNRDYSFYGTFQHRNATPESRSLQVHLDPNSYNRVDAMRQLTDYERIKLLLNPEDTISPHWLSLYGAILSDRSMPASLKAYFLRIDEQPIDRAYAAWYQELVAAREKLMLAVNRRYRDALLKLFIELDTYSMSKRQSPKDGIEDRMLKNILLDLIVVDDSPESHAVVLDHFKAATTAADRVAALLALNRSSAPQRLTLLEEVYANWHAHLSGYANYLRIVGSGTREDVFEMIEAEKKRPGFDITQPTWSRALFMSMAANNKMVWTGRGIRWVADTVIELAPINATTTGRLLSPRAQQPFVTVHCAALAPTLLESELFGHEKGAFTGAHERRIGRFEQAQGGTLFLDEIGEIDATIQVKLLRFLGERTFERVGSNKTLTADVRLIAATNKTLEELVRAGKFREDLFFRLRVVEIQLPPLRERAGDIPLLAQRFLREFARENGKPVNEFTADALEWLMHYSWPGNVRELRAAIEHAVVLCRGEKISARDLPRAGARPAGPPAAWRPSPARNDLTVKEAEKQLIIRALKETAGNRTLAAKKIGMSRRTFHRKLHLFHLEGF